jgi:hypothetical protein
MPISFNGGLPDGATEALERKVAMLYDFKLMDDKVV